MKVFSTWVTPEGWNAEREHRSLRAVVSGEGDDMDCRHIRLVDLMTLRFRIVLRLLWRRRPPFFRLIVFFRRRYGTVVFGFGRA